MKVTWLGQAGLLFETEGTTIIVDPYLSNSVERIEPRNKRRVAVDETFFKCKPDMIVLTHDHLDHTDPDTLRHYLTVEDEVCVDAPNTGKEVCVLASGNAWQTVRKFGGSHNYVQFNRGTQWTEHGIRFTAVKAEHSDSCAIGVVMEAEGKTYYITGDTLYHEGIFGDLPERIDYVFLPVNGRGNNMNFADGKRFCERLGAKAVPMHCGLFDGLDMHQFAYENKVVPAFYQEIQL
ncbi:MAG: MBL fold metallo-hydrolase [Clostridia bacterium]|nr:MBL fold metallo-hydrolase [Clostridia bacterium]